MEKYVWKKFDKIVKINIKKKIESHKEHSKYIKNCQI